MLLGRIIGNVVCTMKDPALIGQKLLIVQPLDRQGRDKGRPVIALDAVGAGTGETIYWCRGRGSQLPISPRQFTHRSHHRRHRRFREYSVIAEKLRFGKIHRALALRSMI